MLQLSGMLTAETLVLANKEHCQIATAILAGDDKAVARSMEAHLERARRFAEELPRAIFRASD